MPDSRLVGLEIPLTPDQVRLIRQVTNEDVTAMVFAVATQRATVEKEFLENKEPLRQEAIQQFARVLYETNVDLVEKIEENPVVKQAIEDRTEVRGFLELNLAPLVDGRLGGSFTGLLAGAAMW